MTFSLPSYTPPVFGACPLATLAEVTEDGVAPDDYHATSNYPEYVHTEFGWLLACGSRMDGLLVLAGRKLRVVEMRCLRRGDMVVLGRTENGEEGVFVHVDGFVASAPKEEQGKFSFRTRSTRETPFSRSYDELYDLLRYERQHGHIIWVLGPAVAFDRDSRAAMQGLIENGFCHGLMAGNALATHDIEAAYFGTGLGQDIYSQKIHHNGHYHHLDIINKVRRAGSLRAGLQQLQVTDGIMYGCEKHNVPYVLAGSIRDDGPLPGVISDVYKGQDAMRVYAGKATTVITIATQLHSIAFGNMLPNYKVQADGTVRKVYLYIIDMTEFSADKLANRGSGQAVAVLTNGQDFVVNLWKNLRNTELADLPETGLA